MTITVVGNTTATTGGSSVSVNYPSSVAAGELLILNIGFKPATESVGSISTPTGWTLINTSDFLGTGTLGTDTGKVNLYSFGYIAAGGETGAIPGLSGTNVNAYFAKIMRFTNDTSSTWSFAGGSWSDITSNTSVSIAPTIGGLRDKDVYISFFAGPSSSITYSSESASATGITFNSFTEDDEFAVNTGFHIGGFVAHASVASGTTSSGTTFTATASGNITGGGIGIRVREVTGLTQSCTWNVAKQIFKTISCTWNVASSTGRGNAAAAAFTVSSGDSSIAPAYPTGIVNHSGLLLFVGQKPATANGGGVTTPTGWTLVTSQLAAGGFGSTLGADTGNTNLYAFFKEADGTESGTLTVSLTDSDVAWAQITRYASITGAWGVSGTSGSDTTANASVSVTGAKALPVGLGDTLVGAFCGPTDVVTPNQFTAEAFTATGATFNGSGVEDVEPFSSVGNDINGFVFHQYGLTGPATAAPVMTATVGGTNTNVKGPGVIVLLQAVTLISSSDTGSGADSGSAAQTKTDSDTGSFVDDGVAAETTVQKSESDTTSLVDSGSVTASFSSSDTGSSVNAESVAVSIAQADTGTGLDVEFISAGVVSVDTATGIDDQQSSAVTEAPDTSTSVETQSLVVSLTDNDAVALADTSSLAAVLVEADSFLADETEEVEGGISEYVTIDEDWAILSDSSTGDVYTISDSEELSPTDLDGSILAGVETESLAVSISLNESLGIGEAAVVSLADDDSFTWVEAQDIIFNSFGDDSSSLTVEAEEIHELVFVTDDDSVSSVEDMVLVDAELPLDDDLSNGLDEESTSALLTEYDLLDGLEDELSAGPTGDELIVGTEEAWTDVILSASDFGFSTDLGIVGQGEADFGTSSELESVAVGLFGNDSFIGLDDSLLTNLDDSDLGASVEDQLLTANFIEDDPATFFEVNLTTGTLADDSAVASEDLVVIDLFDADAGVASEDFVLLEVETADQEIGSLVDDGSPGNSIGDEGLFLELSGIDATTADDDTFGYLDLGYVDIPVAENLVGAELEQLIAFDLELLVGIETASIELSASGETNLLVEAELLNSGLSADDPAISAEVEFLEVLSFETSAGLDLEMAWDAQVYDDDPFLVLDDFTITKVQEHFDDESIDFVESLVDIGLSTLDSGSSTDQITQLAFTDSDLGFGFDGSWVSPLAITDLSSTVEVATVVVNLFSGDSVSGVEGYVGTNLVANDLLGVIDDGAVYADSSEFDSITCEEDFVAVDLVDDESLLADEAITEFSVDVIEDESLLTIEDMVSIEADLATGEDFILFDTQSYFLGDSFTDDEAVVDAVEDEQVVWVISDSDDGAGTEAEFKPKVVPQGMGPEGLSIMRRMTVSMIKTNPIAIALIPEVKVRKDNGTMSYEDGLPRPIQTFMLIPSSYQTKPTQIVDGVERVIDYTLLGRWDAQMERGDHWVGEDGKHYKIIELVPYMPYAYEKKGLVECHG